MNPTCKTCGIAIRWQPTMVGSDPFCCTGCARGGPCICDYEHLPQPDDQASMTIWRALELETRTRIARQIQEE